MPKKTTVRSGIRRTLDRVVFSNLDFYLEYACNLTTGKHVTAPQTIDMGGTQALEGIAIILDKRFTA